MNRYFMIVIVARAVRILILTAIIATIVSCNKDRLSSNEPIFSGKTVKQITTLEIPSYQKVSYDNQNRIISMEDVIGITTYIYEAGKVTRTFKLKSDPASENKITVSLVNGRADKGTFSDKYSNTTITGTVAFTYNSDGTISKYTQIGNDGKTHVTDYIWENGNMTKNFGYTNGTLHSAVSFDYTGGKHDKQNISIGVFGGAPFEQFAGKRSALLPVSIKVISSGTTVIDATITYVMDAEGYITQQKYSGTFYSVQAMTANYTY